VRVFIQYDRQLDLTSWTDRYTAGLVADEMPYGLHYLRDQGWEPSFRRARPSTLLDRLVRPADARLGLDVAAVIEEKRARRCADVVFSWNEGVGFPTAWPPRRQEPPSVTGCIWATDKQMPPSMARIVQISLRRSAAVVLLSSGQVARVREMGVLPSRAQVVPMGVDSEAWVPQAVGPVPGFVMSAGNDEHRDWMTLKRAMETVSARGAAVRLRVLSQRAPDIFPEGVVQREDVSLPVIRAAYDEASIVVVATVPNLHASGITVCLEAMAMARPVIATRTPGMEHYIVDGETGLLVPAGDHGALALSILRLLNDPAEAREMGLRGRERVLARFTTRHQASALAEVFALVTRQPTG
jgi:glycosyltransferase involved in cell wall biosynthesis